MAHIGFKPYKGVYLNYVFEALKDLRDDCFKPYKGVYLNDEKPLTSKAIGLFQTL